MINLLCEDSYSLPHYIQYAYNFFDQTMIFIINVVNHEIILGSFRDTFEMRPLHWTDQAQNPAPKSLRRKLQVVFTTKFCNKIFIS